MFRKISDAKCDAVVKGYKSLNVDYMDLQGRWWRIRPTREIGCGSRWPFLPPDYVEGVGGAWVIPFWAGGEVPPNTNIGMMREARESLNHFDYLDIRPARVWAPGSNFSAHAVVIPGANGAIASGLARTFGLDLLIEFTPTEWMIDSRMFEFHVLGWKRSIIRSAP